MQKELEMLQGSSPRSSQLVHTVQLLHGQRVQGCSVLAHQDPGTFFEPKDVAYVLYPNLTLPNLTLPNLTLPNLTLPYLT
jgi:hypothetical protein